MTTTELKPILPAAKGSNRDRARRRWVTVEPVISMAVVGYISVGLVRPFYLKSRLGESLYNFTSSDEFSKCEANDTEDETIEDNIQSEASLWLLYLVTAINIPVIFSSIIVGTLSERFGRKLCMVLPLIGYICQETVYIVTVYYKLPLAVLFIGEVLQGMTGGFALLVAGCLSYLIDVTTEEQRTLRIAVAEMLVFLIGGVVQIGAGYLIRDFSPIPPLAISLGLNIFCLLYIATPGILIETVDRNPGNRKGIRDIGRRVMRLLKFNENGRRWQMLLLYLFQFFVLVNVNGSIAIFILYGTAKPFCWTAVTAGLAGSFAFITSSLGMLIGTKLFSLCLGDYWIMQISCLSLLLFNIVMGVSKTTLLIFVANTLGTLRAMGFPVARSILSKIVDPTEIGPAFAIVACLDSLSGFVANLMAPSIYAVTVADMPQFIFYLFSGLCAIPIGFVPALQIFWPRRKAYRPLHRSDYEECNVNETQTTGNFEGDAEKSLKDQDVLVESSNLKSESLMSSSSSSPESRGSSPTPSPASRRSSPSPTPSPIL